MGSQNREIRQYEDGKKKPKDKRINQHNILYITWTFLKMKYKSILVKYLEVYVL